MKFVIKSAVQGENGIIYWVVIAGANGETVFVTETYTRKQGAIEAIELARANIGPDTPVEDTTLAAQRAAG